MRTLTLQNTLYREKTISGTAIESGLQEWRSSFVVAATLGGLCGLTGLILSGLHLFGMSGSYHFVDNVGAGLLVMAFLLFSLAAHSLDRAREFETAIRIDRCKRTGMIVDEEK